MIQRFNSAIDLSVHYHTLFLDGAYSFPPGREPVFHPTRAPTGEDVARIVVAVFRRVECVLADREPDAAQRRFIEGAPVLAAVAEASARGFVATGPRRGRRIIRIRGAYFSLASIRSPGPGRRAAIYDLLVTRRECRFTGDEQILVSGRMPPTGFLLPQCNRPTEDVVTAARPWVTQVA